MKYLIAFATCCCLSACSVKFYPLKSKYPDTPITFTTEKSFDHVWDKLVDLFAQKGISIRIIDRSSGLISSAETPLTCSYEDKKGNLYNPKAFIVLKRNNYQGDQNMKITHEMDGEWNVHLTRLGDKISVNVNIVDLKYFTVNYSLYRGESKLAIPFQGHTTGVFEKLIFDAVN